MTTAKGDMTSFSLGSLLSGTEMDGVAVQVAGVVIGDGGERGQREG